MTIKPTIFKPEDFQDTKASLTEDIRENCASIANRIIESKLGPKVYGNVEHEVWSSDFKSVNDTHTAYLFDIQKLPEKPCEHEPIYWDNVIATPVLCRHCNEFLTARWEAKK